MLYDSIADYTPRFSLPHPPAVKLDRIAVRPDGSRGRSIVYFVDLSSNPVDELKMEAVHLESVVSEERIVKRGCEVFRAGSECKSIFVVRSGSFKSVVSGGNRLTHVTGFLIGGELLGLGGLSTCRHDSDAIALEDSSVCIIPVGVLEKACHHTMAMQWHVHRLMSTEFARDANLMLMLGAMSAEQRLATFLLDLSSRYRLRGYSATQFRLHMTRGDICSFLGMTRSMLAGTFSRLRERRLIEAKGAEVKILRLAELASLC